MWRIVCMQIAKTALFTWVVIDFLPKSWKRIRITAKKCLASDEKSVGIHGNSKGSIEHHIGVNGEDHQLLGSSVGETDTVLVSKGGTTSQVLKTLEDSRRESISISSNKSSLWQLENFHHRNEANNNNNNNNSSLHVEDETLLELRNRRKSLVMQIAKKLEGSQFKTDQSHRSMPLHSNAKDQIDKYFGNSIQRHSPAVKSDINEAFLIAERNGFPSGKSHDEQNNKRSTNVTPNTVNGTLFYPNRTNQLSNDEEKLIASIVTTTNNKNSNNEKKNNNNNNNHSDIRNVTAEEGKDSSQTMYITNGDPSYPPTVKMRRKTATAMRQQIDDSFEEILNQQRFSKRLSAYSISDLLPLDLSSGDCGSEPASLTVDQIISEIN